LVVRLGVCWVALYANVERTYGVVNAAER
jgi:hypothetical protein